MDVVCQVFKVLEQSQNFTKDEIYYAEEHFHSYFVCVLQIALSMSNKKREEDFACPKCVIIASPGAQ